MPLSSGYGRPGAPVLAIAPYLTNLESFAVHTTPIVVHQASGEQTSHSGFPLESLWKSYEAWSAYGAEVPLTLNTAGGFQEVVQSYVPYLSGLQIFGAPAAPSSASSSGSVASSEEIGGLDDLEPESEQRSPSGMAEAVSPPPPPQGICPATPDPDSVLARRYGSDQALEVPREGSGGGSSLPSREACGPLLCEYFETAPPHTRPPLSSAIAQLASERWPGLLTARSSELSRASWYAVAWYPLYSVPAPAAAGPARALHAAFLTFHELGTGGGTAAGPLMCPASPSVAAMLTWRAGAAVHASRVHPAGAAALRPFGLTPYKAVGRAWRDAGDSGKDELHAAAGRWLRARGVELPDFSYFDKALQRVHSGRVQSR